MTTKKIALITTLTFLVFVIAATIAELVLKPRGTERLLLVGGLTLLGLLAAFLVFLYLSARARRAAAQGAGGKRDDVIDAALSAARAHLAPVGRIGQLPAVLVLGPSGGAKTTVVSESGLQPELVAGEVKREGMVVPTGGVNLWYAQGTVFAEAGGTVLDEPARWQRLVRHLRARRLAAAFSKRKQAPRAAVVCFPADELVRAGAAQSALAAAQALRTRLLDVSGQFGVRLPVYVVFTRADRFPHFTEYVRSLSAAEAQEVLGATLPAQAPGAAALYAERETGRLADAFKGVLRSLSLRRGDLLGREVDESVRAAAYEFPREVRKVQDIVIQFLVELTRPSHLSVSPFLRGFYFTGVRPVLVEDASAAAPAAAPRPVSAPDATGVFDPRALQAGALPATAAPRGTRRIPEWVFLKRLFTEVILADRSAMNVTAGGAHVNRLRRVALVAAALVCLVAIVGFIVSYANNRQLQGVALDAARGVQGMDVTANDALPRLDAVRNVAARVRGWEENGRPLGRRWGLYSGKAVLLDLRRIYFHYFDQVLWGTTRNQLLASLRALPSEPNATSAYGPTYDGLKAHLITTLHPEASTADFLAPVLMRYYRPLMAPDSIRAAMAYRQFAFFGHELPYGNPYTYPPDAAAVEQTQRFLGQFGDTQRLYASLVAEADEHAPAIQYSRLVPTAAPVVRDEVIVPGAFTKPGWAYVQGRLKDVDRLFERETWVTGPAAVAPQDRVRLARELGQQYATDYVAHWQEYLTGASVGGLGGAAEASRTLSRLSDNQSPLLQLFAIASRNTNVDTATVGKAFQPVHVVVPPGATDKLVADATMPYLKGLSGLQAALAQMATATGPAIPAAATQVQTSADQVNGSILQITQAFSVAAEARPAGEQVRRLLQLPISGAGALVASAPVAGMNQNGQSFCAQVGRVLAKYPFNPRSGTDASMDEVAQLFAPNNNAFSQFAAGLSNVMVQQGGQWAAKIGATPQPSPAFLAFFNRAGDVSRALYDPSGNGPEVTFTLRPQTSPDMPEVTINIDGQTQTFTRTVAAARSFTWDGTRANSAQIAGRLGGGASTTLLQAPAGSWALFRLLQQAEWQRSGGGRYMLHWRLPQGQDLAAELNIASGTPIFNRDYIGGIRCVSEVAR
jgi:type VI secretion system protein ImpL